MTRKNRKELKAKITDRNQKINYLKRAVRRIKEAHKIEITLFKETKASLLKQLTQTQDALKESQRKKWYQYEQI